MIGGRFFCQRFGHAVKASDCHPDGKTTFRWGADGDNYMKRACPRCGEDVKFPLTAAPYYPPNLPRTP